jgi:galactitol-specific phosphotransferase system IIB component
LGAAIGAGIATSIGIAVETEIKKGIRDQGLQAEFEEATVGRYLAETFTAMLSTGGTKTFSKWIEKIPLEKFSSTSKMLGKAMRKGVKEAGNREIKNITDKCAIPAFSLEMWLISILLFQAW